MSGPPHGGPGPRPRVLVVQHEGDAGPGRLVPALQAAADLDVRRPDLGEPLPPDLAGHAGLLVLGGMMGATDDVVAPWLPATRRLLAAGVAAGVPTLGICLGAQLLAVATGGRVERGAAGLEVGETPVVLAAAATDDALLGPVAAAAGPAPLVQQFHQDVVTRLPPGAVLLARGERYPHQAFRLGTRAWGVQYHPEVTAADWSGWLRDGHGAVTAAGLDVADLLAASAALEPELARLAHAHGAAFAALLGRGGDADRPVAPRDTVAG